MSATQTLAQCIVDTRFETLPPEVVQAAKIAILDGFATMLAGATQELATIIGAYVQEMGGTPQASVIGWGFKTNPVSAAFANGVFGHCLDYEIQGFPPTHGTSSCLPAALALGEANRVPGSTIIEAYVVGWDIQGRLRAASAAAANPGWHPPGMVGPLGGAAASAKVLGLDTHQTQMALGIAASRTGGLTANTGTMVKATHPGNAARMGTEAALLAGKGYTANAAALEAPHGYAEALFQGHVAWDVVTGNWRTPYRLVDPGYDIKRFPAQVYMQTPIEAVLHLRQKYNLEAEMVEQLTIHRQGRGHAGPLPRSGLDGKFSVEYCAAAALLDGQVVIDTFTDQRRFAPDMEATLRKVRVEPVEQEPGVVTVEATLKDGRTVTGACRGFKGAAHNPMTREEHMVKVWDCVDRALPKVDAEAMMALLEDLEHVPDMAVLMQIVGQKSPARSSIAL
jgi:2-methylcitrate dehydratase PrpD